MLLQLEALWSDMHRLARRFSLVAEVVRNTSGGPGGARRSRPGRSRKEPGGGREARRSQEGSGGARRVQAAFDGQEAFEGRRVFEGRQAF